MDWVWWIWMNGYLMDPMMFRMSIRIADVQDLGWGLPLRTVASQIAGKIATWSICNGGLYSKLWYVANMFDKIFELVLNGFKVSWMLLGSSGFNKLLLGFHRFFFRAFSPKRPQLCSQQLRFSSINQWIDGTVLPNWDLDFITGFRHILRPPQSYLPGRILELGVGGVLLKMVLSHRIPKEPCGMAEVQPWLRCKDWRATCQNTVPLAETR